MSSKPTPRTSVIVFPFDLFGSTGTGAGAELLGDALREMFDDNALEERPTRGDAYRDLVSVKDLTFGTTKVLNAWKQTGRKALKQSLNAREQVIWLGGNHFSVLPVYEELGTGTLVIQLDAHLDIHQFHDVMPTPANGNFLLHSDAALPQIVNVGHRDLLLHPKEWRGTFAQAISSVEVATDPARVLNDIRTRVGNAKRVWIDIDVDVFDPAFVPAVHQPLPFGMTPLMVLQVLTAAWSAENVVGVSISEFDPGRDVRDTSLNLLGWLLEWILLKWYEE
jgi:agmatinase